MKTSKELNDKIKLSKKIIKEEKKKIRLERKNIRNIKIKKFKKTKFGKFLGSIFFIFNNKKNKYSFSEVSVITLVSVVFGFIICLFMFTIFFHGGKYFKLSKQLNKFFDVYDVLIDNYYGDVDKDKLIESAINGMVSSVGDVYTSYNTVNETDKFNQLVSGTYEGIGCTITKKEDNIVVVEVYDGPAKKAGLKEGDIIKTVDKLEGMSVSTNELSNYIKNEATGDIKMVIIRDNEELSLTLKRDKIEIPTVNGEVISNDNKKIGYIDIDIFSSVSAKQFENKLKELEKDKISGLVIDVRNNNGGYLSTVSEIANMLLPKGNIVYQVKKGKKQVVVKDKTSTKREYPIAILINENSASASEILAGVIKESYNGYAVGTKTYGKGTVQQVKKLRDGSMIKYTIEDWLTPKGNWINEKGIEPTDEVILDKKYYEEPKRENDNQLKKAIELISK